MNTSQINTDIIGFDNEKIILLPLSVYVKQTLEHYLSQLSEHETFDIHSMVISEVEKPLLEVALKHSGYNQTKAAKTLGLSRSTLRKKLNHYGLS